ncbi:DUF1036 domain-containing protein [Leisingera sp. D0M16]|uniref:DUF1036 domain-containing protein n=1 Tax=Leisingera coralii TaxID=3351347 RepID=UPI003BA39091
MTTAQAGPRICNDTGALHHLAVVLRDGGSWVAQGWQRLHPGDCAEPVPREYQGKFLYFRSESPGYNFRDDGVRFCTAPGRFRITHGGDCAGKNQVLRGFAKADLDQRGQPVLLSTRSKGGEDGETASRPHHQQHNTDDGLHFSAEVVFQGCKLNPAEETVTCKFVGHGIEIGSEGRLQVSDPVFTYLLGLLRGAPVEVDGDMISRLGSFGELDLHSVTPRVPDRFDRILQMMQGVWQSERSPLDRFAISGAMRRVSYAGRRMTPEFLSVQDSCQGAGGADFLMAWDSLRGSSLCYQIKSLTEDRMTLIYLPRGIRLDYRRVH